jgi:hypothetical protein
MDAPLFIFVPQNLQVESSLSMPIHARLILHLGVQVMRQASTMKQEHDDANNSEG